MLTRIILSALVIANEFELLITKDIVAAVKEIDQLKKNLKDVHTKVDEFHQKWYAEVEKMCDSVGSRTFSPKTVWMTVTLLQRSCSNTI